MKEPLNFLVTFSESAMSIERIKIEINNFIDEILPDESNLNLHISEPRNIWFDNIYKTDIFLIEINLTYSSSDIGRLINTIIQEWCNPKKNCLSMFWLSLADVSVLENSGKLCHSDVLVKEIAFGTMPDMQHFMQHYHYVTNSVEKEIMSTFLHSQRKCTVYSCFTHNKVCSKKLSLHNKFQFSFNSVCRVVVNYIPDSDLVQIFFHLQHIPLLYVGKRKGNKYENDANVEVLGCDQEYQNQKWDRTLDFGCTCKNFSCSVERIGRCPIFKMVIPKKHKTHDIIVRLIQRCPSSTVFHFANIENVYLSKNTVEVIDKFDKFPFPHEFLKQPFTNEKKDIIFKCQFAWDVLLSRSLEVRDQILLPNSYPLKINPWTQLCDKLNKYFEKNIDALVNTVYHISEMIHKNFIFNFENTLTELFNYYCKQKSDEHLPDGMCLVRRIILSPSRIICIQPTEHFDNRIIREYGSENLLRVSIRDDDFGKLTFAIQHIYEKNKFLNRVIHKFLLHGITIGNRKYEFLAASNSQLREHGLWMYAEDHKGNTADTIRKWMGDFRHIKNVAKYMARMGQCFSTSDEAVQITLNENEIDEIPDLTTKDGKFKFSDGVGMISLDLAKEVRRAFAKRNNLTVASEKYLYDPSAFQIRFKGCKGMIAESNILHGCKIAIRPSMKKFLCNSSSVLEIVKISAPRAVFLNRPLISILENLGVKDTVFLDLQKKMVFDLTNSLIYEKKAYKMLENNTSLNIPFKKLNNAGISMTQEPFFRSLLLTVYKSMIEKLKCKARIAIPHKYGRNMMGIVDETGTLKEDEIFAQYSEKVSNIKSKTKILKGTVVVTKNPCMHPGDVRKLKAVDVPGLQHIKDCIVFPAVGERPLPDQMAGSDCDGDEYVLIWDTKLIFPGENKEAMSYPSNDEYTLDKDIEVEDMVDFFCRYIKDDDIGTMANAHLVWTDYNDEGIFSKVCMDIAKKYPKALDFAKSGTTCTLDPKERPKYYPDFMEKGSRNNNYKSTKSLGLLYRVIRNLEANVSNIDHKLYAIPNLKLEVTGWQCFKQLAEKRRQQYSDRVNNILKKYGLKNESEVLTGYVRRVNEYNANKYDSENVATLSKKYLIDTIKRFRNKFFKDCNVISNECSLHEKVIKQKMASAWYMVTYADPEVSILSFPWVMNDVLIEIQIESYDKVPKLIDSKSVFIDNFDDKLKSLPNTFIQKAVNDNSCVCVLILEEKLQKWISSSFILTTSSKDIFCGHCLQRIIETFREKVACCSFNESSCNCTKACSPMKLILKCLEYYASGAAPEIGKCKNNLGGKIFCDGFKDMNLHSLALKTYAALPITQNLKYLGYENGEQCDIDNSNEEGNPIRVPVTREFDEILTGNVDKVCEILKSLSGVKKVHIDGSSESRGYYILVHSIGRAFQRWNLEELIMDSECPSLIKKRMNLE